MGKQLKSKKNAHKKAIFIAEWTLKLLEYDVAELMFR